MNHLDENLFSLTIELCSLFFDYLDFRSLQLCSKRFYHLKLSVPQINLSSHLFRKLSIKEDNFAIFYKLVANFRDLKAKSIVLTHSNNSNSLMDKISFTSILELLSTLNIQSLKLINVCCDLNHQISYQSSNLQILYLENTNIPFRNEWILQNLSLTELYIKNTTFNLNNKLEDQDILSVMTTLQHLKIVSLQQCMNLKCPFILTPTLQRLDISNCCFVSKLFPVYLCNDFQLIYLNISFTIIQSKNLETILKYSLLLTHLIAHSLQSDITTLTIKSNKLEILDLSFNQTIEYLNIQCFQLKQLNVILMIKLNHLIISSNLLKHLKCCGLSNLIGVYLNCKELITININGCNNLGNKKIQISLLILHFTNQIESLNWLFNDLYSYQSNYSSNMIDQWFKNCPKLMNSINKMNGLCLRDSGIYDYWVNKNRTNRLESNETSHGLSRSNSMTNTNANTNLNGNEKRPLRKASNRSASL